MGMISNTQIIRRVAMILLLGLPAAAHAAPVRVEAFGDSLFAGFGLQEADAFPARLQAALRQDGFDATVVAAAISGDTTSGGVNRADWMLGDDPALVIVELGGNDMLRAIDPSLTRDNLDRICARISDRHVPMVLAGMMASPGLGETYVKKFDAIYPDLARKYDTPLYPFVLQDVMFHPELMQKDGIHPNAKGVEVLVRGILPLVEGQLRKGVHKNG